MLRLNTCERRSEDVVTDLVFENSGCLHGAGQRGLGLPWPSVCCDHRHRFFFHLQPASFFICDHHIGLRFEMFLSNIKFGHV